MNKAKVTKGKKFKSVELDAKEAPVTNIEWEGEELVSESSIKLTDDLGEGKAIVLRFFEFGANPETFRVHKPTAQELFNCHIKGMESLLWRDGLKPFIEVEPRLMFSKDRTKYRFILAAEPLKDNNLLDRTKTLTQLLTNPIK